MNSKLPDILTNTLDNTSFSQSLLSIAGEDKVIKALVDTVLTLLGVPLASIITSGIVGNISYLQQTRTITLFDEMKKNPKMLNEAVINNEFVHKFMITYKAVLATYSDEKIRFFANLFKNGADESLGIDVFEEYLDIINDLSYRELKILQLIDFYYEQYGPVERKPDIDFDSSNEGEELFKEFKVELYNKLEKDYKIDKDEIRDFLTRLARSRLYRLFIRLGGTNGEGTLTPLYYHIKSYITREHAGN